MYKIQGIPTCDYNYRRKLYEINWTELFGGYLRLLRDISLAFI